MANPPATSIKEVFAAMPTRFNAGAAKGLKAVYQFDLTGDNGAKYNLAIDDGKLTVGEGTHASPSITITMAASDYLDMANGKLNRKCLHERQAEDRGRHGPRDEDATALPDELIASRPQSTRKGSSPTEMDGAPFSVSTTRCVAGPKSIRCRGRDREGGMNAALDLSATGPTSGAFVFAGEHRARTGRASDAGVPLLEERVQR